MPEALGRVAREGFVRADLDLDVGAAVGTGARYTQRATVVASTARPTPTAMLICLAGTGYRRACWDLQVPGHTGYSFAEYLSGRGYLVVCLDHLGAGDSVDPPGGGPGGLDLVAAGDAEAARQLRARAAAGSLHPQIAPADLPVVCVGHSLGAGIGIMAQAAGADFQAMVLLGYAATRYDHSGAPGAEQICQPGTVGDLEAAIKSNYELVRQFTQSPRTATSWSIPRSYFRGMFYTPDVPAEVVAADEALESRIPAWANAAIMTPGVVAPHAAAIDVPLFLGFGGAMDFAPAPRQEVDNFPGTNDVTVFLLADAAHAHHVAPRRADLWDRIARWVSSVV